MENALSDLERGNPSSRAKRESKGQTTAPVTTPYFVYILRCADGTLYVGSTSDIEPQIGSGIPDHQ